MAEATTTTAVPSAEDIVVWGDNEKRIKTIQSMFFGTLPEPLLKPGRVLVGEGILLKQCRKKLKPRQFFLFTDVLLYADILVSKKSYNKPHFLHLKDISVAATSDERAIQIFNPQRSFLVYTATPDEAREWITHINLCIKKLPTAERDTKANPAAIWIPDKDADNCMVCRTTKFTLLNRRHHCRQCGRVACGNCTKQKFSLPPNNRPERVCNACFAFLTSQAAAATSGATAKADTAAQTPASPTDVAAATAALTLDAADAADKPDESEAPAVPTGPTLAQQASGVDPDDDDDDDDADGPAAPSDKTFVAHNTATAPADATATDPAQALDAMFAFTTNTRASVFFTDDFKVLVPPAAEGAASS